MNGAAKPSPVVLQPDDATALAAVRRGSRDMAALLALPAMWVERAPTEIAQDLVSVLFAVLRLESGYVRLEDPDGGAPVEWWRPTGSEPPEEVQAALAHPGSLGRYDTSEQPLDVDGCKVATISQAFIGESCLLVASAHRAEFPTDLDLYLMRVVASQAVVAIHNARLLEAERVRRRAAEDALRMSTDFLAELARDLAAPAAMLAQRASTAEALANDRKLPKASTALPTPRVDDSSEGPGEPNLPAALSQREIEVLGLLGQGLSNKEIAGVMWLSARTIERHVTNIYRKLGVERRGEATALALRYGLVPPSA